MGREYAGDDVYGVVRRDDGTATVTHFDDPEQKAPCCTVDVTMTDAERAGEGWHATLQRARLEIAQRHKREA